LIRFSVTHILVGDAGGHDGSDRVYPATNRLASRRFARIAARTVKTSSVSHRNPEVAGLSTSPQKSGCGVCRKTNCRDQKYPTSCDASGSCATPCFTRTLQYRTVSVRTLEKKYGVRRIHQNRRGQWRGPGLQTQDLDRNRRLSVRQSEVSFFCVRAVMGLPSGRPCFYQVCLIKGMWREGS
jgi:hypothetical protein